MNKVKKGPDPDFKKDNKVLKLREKNKLSFRDIAFIMKSDPGTVYRRYKRALAGCG